MSRRQAAVDVVLTVLLVLASATLAGLVIGLVSSGPPSLSAAVAVQGLLAIAGVYVMLDWREQPWSAIGLTRPSWRDVGRGLLVLAAGFAVNTALAAAAVALSPQTLEQHIETLSSVAADLTLDTPLPQALAVLVIVGFYEEVLSRGLLLTRSRRLLGGYWPPVLFSALLFSLGHFYQGLYGVLQTALFGIVLAAFTLRWGTLWPAIIAHTAINMLSLVQLDDLATAG
ncbi:MAG: CPBP family intramembrane metalloprotease [Gammaproteobacteria bacterium]|nr:CPBP family intramembrane metalloprotease [Gammaproteobacteria bacterium]